jgi:hypothetical protein
MGAVVVGLSIHVVDEQALLIAVIVSLGLVQFPVSIYSIPFLHVPPFRPSVKSRPNSNLTVCDAV